MKKTLKGSEIFDLLFSNSEIGSMLEANTELMEKEITIDEIEEFVKEIHRNSLILFNVINGEK